MGDKTEARRAMIAAGVPVTPGTEGNLANLDEAKSEAARIGYPIMLKATSGGGGRGIRRCDNDSELERNFDRVISEATKAFGSADVFLEKCIVNPKHIEVQILADKFGNTIHLFERDCSIQRRNQKLIEIAPSPQLTPEQRAYVGDLAVRAAQAVDYENAGTVEFLLADNQVYFMEMNTRVQVEHTITEQITGVDIVREQIRIAAGLPLGYRQEDIHHRGFALQFRVNAEDPKNNFLPTFGKISRYYAPGGPGVRVDTAIYTGYTIPPYFDSMCLKLIVWSLTWEEALNRGSRALDDMRVQGVKTTVPYYQRILADPEFRLGRFDTSFVESHPELTQYSDKKRPEEIALAVATAIAAYAGL
jgi:pyruvate carboxylase subunit A